MSFCTGFISTPVGDEKFVGTIKFWLIEKQEVLFRLIVLIVIFLQFFFFRHNFISCKSLYLALPTLLMTPSFPGGGRRERFDL